MAYGLKDSGTKLLFADQERIDRIKQIKDGIKAQVISRASRQ